jgi:hypothetical protein
MRIKALLVALCLPAAASAQSQNWVRYDFEDGAAAVDLPAHVFSVDSGSSKAGRGHSFATADGRADLSLYTIPRSRRSPSQFLAQDFQLPWSAIVYRRVTGNMLAVSGYRGDRIWYVRCNFGAENLHCIALNYPAAEKPRWDAIVTRISRSLSQAG